uniref:hypothetical protein n=1 Tax=Paenarthrobacter nicotinovorans TaxID=29320 RepID=UPI003F49924C
MSLELVFATLLGLLIIISAVGIVVGVATFKWVSTFLIIFLLGFIAFGLITVQINSAEETSFRLGAKAGSALIIVDISKNGQIVSVISNNKELEMSLRHTILATNIYRNTAMISKDSPDIPGR